MDDSPGLGAALPIGVHMGHHIVAELLFILRRLVKINIINMGPHFVQLLIGDGQSQRLLAFGQGDPQLPPGFELKIRGVDILHFLAGIARIKGRIISICLH